MESKTEELTCHDFESLRNKCTEVFNLDIGSFLIFILGEDEELIGDEPAIESQTDFDDELSSIGD